MNSNKLSIKTIAFTSILLTLPTQAADYGVSMKYTTNDAHAVLDNMSTQKEAFSELINQGLIKDMYIRNSEVDGKELPIIKFVISGENEEEIKSKLSTLPFHKKNFLEIENIKLLGAKWLDSTPQYENYSLTFKWIKPIKNIEFDKILGNDLQRIIALNQAGQITSSYLNTQEDENGMVKPVYLLSIRAQNEKNAKELSKQFDAVLKGYANVDVAYLGYKIDLNKK